MSKRKSVGTSVLRELTPMAAAARSNLSSGETRECNDRSGELSKGKNSRFRTKERSVGANRETPS